MNDDRNDIGLIYESIYAGDAVYGDEDKDKGEDKDKDKKKGKKDNDSEDTDEKDTDTSDESSEDTDNDSDNDDSSDNDNPFGGSDSDDDDDDDSEGSDDEDGDSDDEDGDSEGSDDEDGDSEGEGGDPKGDGSFSTDVDSLRKQYSELLANVFSEFAPDAIEAALDGSDGPFGDNIQTIIQTAIDHLKGMIYDEFELEELELDAIDPSAMGSFDPNAASDTPMELEIGSPVPELDGVMDADVGGEAEVGPDLEIPTADSNEEEEDESGLEEACKKGKKKVSKLEECAENFAPVAMRRQSRMSQAYNK